MNIIEKANQKSTLQYLLRDKSVNPFIYVYDTNFSDGIKNTCYVYPDVSSTLEYGSIVRFQLPKYGHLVKAFIESSITTAGDNSASLSNVGERVFEWIELQTVRGSQVIQRTTENYIRMRIDNLDDATCKRMNILTEPNTAFNNNTVIVYTPFFGFFSEHPNKFLDIDFCEPLQIVAKINDNKTLMGLDEDITEFSFRLHLTYFTTFGNTALNPYKYPITYLTSNEYNELPITLSLGDTTAKSILGVDKSVFATHFLIKNSTQDIFNISDITIKVDGKTFYESSNRLSLMDYGWYSHSGLNIDTVRPAENLGNRFFSIFWSMFQDRNHNTLCINFNDLGAVEAYITFPTLNDATCKLYIIHEYFDFTTINDKGLFERDLIN